MGYDLILLGVLAVMIFFLFQQNRRRRKEAEQLVAALEVGANVLLHSGIKGTVTQIIDDSDIEIETTPKVKLRVVKQAVRAIEAAKEN